MLSSLHLSLSRPPPLDEVSAVRMQTIKTVETQVPFLKESFFTTTFKGRRKSSVSNILRKQQHSLLGPQHQQQQRILEHHQEQSAQFPPPSVENGQGQHTPEHRSLARSTSSPLCKTAERAGADGGGKEGQRERKDQSSDEAVQGRGGERGVSGREPVAVSASLLLLSSSASASATLGEAASLSQLPLTVPGRQQGSGSSVRSLTNRGRASAAAQEEAQHAQPRPQQHGLLAKGVRLFRNMGNQEAKQRKAGGGGGTAAGDASCDGDADERDADKKSKKSHSKTSKGGEPSGKKKTKSESKGSVFSGMKIRKSLSKMKALSKDDILEDGRSAHFGKAGLSPGADPSLSADDMGMISDVEGDLSHLTTGSQQSIVDDIGRKTSSGSDADLYSFHSAAAENEDLLSDIQQAIRDQSEATDRVLEMVAGKVARRSSSVGCNAGRVFNLDEHVLSSSAGAKGVAEEVIEACKKLENESRVLPISRNSSGPGSLSERSPPSSAPDTERSSGSLFPKTNSSYSFPDTATTTTSYESAEEPQDDLESHQQSIITYGTCVLLDPGVAAGGPMGSHKSVSSMDLSMEREEDNGKRDFLSLKRRKSSLSISHLITDPNASQPRWPSSISPSAVKYPPVHPSYVKTTTRQLSSPIGSPITSPNVPRKTDTPVTPVEPSEAKGFKKHKQRSCSIAGPISASLDWSTELDEFRGKNSGGTRSTEPDTPEKSYTGGNYWTLGSRRAHYSRKASNSAVQYLDVFSGESHKTPGTEPLPYMRLFRET